MDDRKFKVIIAEDEYRIRSNIASKITEVHSRFSVTAAAEDGREALTLIKKEQPDLLITDIRMPVLDGLELIEELYFSYPELPVIILSGYDDFSYAQKAIHFGVKDYILKPVSKKELSELLQRMEVVLSKNDELYSCLHEEYESDSAATELCGKITEYIKASYNKDISISDLAETFSLNPTYMSRVFKQQTGRTPTRFITELRINQAKKLLVQQTELEIKEVAVLTGFQDQGYFSRLFKKESGVSPLDYRKQKLSAVPGTG